METNLLPRNPEMQRILMRTSPQVRIPKIITFTCALTMICIVSWWSILEKEPKLIIKETSVILAWNTFFDDLSFLVTDLSQLGCSVPNCFLTYDRSLFQSAKAVLFHVRTANSEDLPEIKPSDQKWVMINYEAPPHLPPDVLERLAPNLDWIVSYRRDSEFFSDYGRIRPRRLLERSVVLSEKTFNEKLPVAWLVSNCDSTNRREELVQRMMEHIRVDIFGACAYLYGQPNKSWDSSDRMEAYKFLAKRYKFYLSFENSLCTDYVTEKVFYPLYVGMVPVVFGRADYQKILPPNSFVDVRSFTSPRHLAKHLAKISNNFTLYKSYNKWRKHFAVEQIDVTNGFLCDICARLRSKHNDEPNSNRQQDILSRWNATQECINPVSLKLFNTS